MYVEYSSNNSGGSWWLNDQDWLALEEAGWEVLWSRNNEFHGNAERWLGALATSAIRRGLPLREAVDEWERITNCSSTDAGCPCCGKPHYFTEYTDEGEYVKSGPDVSCEAHW